MKDESLIKLNEWREELQEAVETLDVKTFRKFYARWTEKGVYNENVIKGMSDEVIEISIRKLAVNMSGIKPKIKAEAKAWLLERGYDLKMN